MASSVKLNQSASSSYAAKVTRLDMGLKASYGGLMLAPVIYALTEGICAKAKKAPPQGLLKACKGVSVVGGLGLSLTMLAAANLPPPK